MEILNVKENEDGSAVFEIECEKKELEIIIEHFFNNALKNIINEQSYEVD